MVERDRRGHPLSTPFPLARRALRAALLVAGIALALLVPRAALAPVLLGTAVAALAGPRLLVPTPYPAFLTLRRQEAHTLEPHAWIRLRDGWAVQALNVHIRLPDTVGDPTPPQVLIRCSDDVTRTFRPHDLLHVVQPVDLRR
jgi:hypothetical protein